MNVSGCSLGKELFYRRACNNVRNKLQLIYVANADFFSSPAVSLSSKGDKSRYSSQGHSF